MSIITLLIWLLGVQPSLPAADSTEPIRADWVKADSIFISRWISTAIEEPAKITRHFRVHHRPFLMDTLGFGYTFYTASAGKGYVSCFYSLLFHNGLLISFELSPQMPGNPVLDSTYRKFYSRLFEFYHEGKSIRPYRWQSSVAQMPIRDRQFQLTPQSPTDPYILELMTPFVGIDYGFTGGFGGDTLSSRRLFERVKQSLVDSDISCLLRSINPSTRLMTIEYLRGRRYRTGLDATKLKHDISLIFSRHPRVRTMNGCNVDIQDARTLVNIYSRR